MTIKKKCFTVQCCKCLCILGISSKNFQKEKIYCMKCAKKEIGSNPKSQTKEYKCIVCKKEINGNEPCKCMENYSNNRNKNSRKKK